MVNFKYIICLPLYNTNSSELLEVSTEVKEFRQNTTGLTVWNNQGIKEPNNESLETTKNKKINGQGRLLHCAIQYFLFLHVSICHSAEVDDLLEYKQRRALAMTYLGALITKFTKISLGTTSTSATNAWAFAITNFLWKMGMVLSGT